MAGRSPNFNRAAFVKGIHFAMDMGAPPDSAEQLAFYMPSTLVYNATVDEDDVPFDPRAVPVTAVRPDPIKVPAAVEYADASGVYTDLGIITPSRINVTLLDEDYRKIKGCVFCILKGVKYMYRHTEAPQGLFDVGIYVLAFVAEDVT